MQHPTKPDHDDEPVPSTRNADRDSREFRVGRGLKYVIYFAIAVGIFMLLSRRSSGPDEGRPAADFELPAVSGTSFHLAAQHGHPVVIEAFASWCPTCRRTAPMLADAARAQRASKVQFVGVSVDDSTAQTSAVKNAWSIPYPVLHDDGRFARLYKITLLPTIIVIDAEGRVRHVTTGMPRRSTLEGWLADVGAKAI